MQFVQSATDWQEIGEFASPGEFERFSLFMEGQVAAGVAKIQPADPTYRKGEITGGRWFENLETGLIWRLIEPDFPFRGVFEPVNRNDLDLE